MEIITVYHGGGGMEGVHPLWKNPLCSKITPSPLKNYTLCSAPPSGIGELSSLWGKCMQINHGDVQILLAWVSICLLCRTPCSEFVFQTTLVLQNERLKGFLWAQFYWSTAQVQFEYTYWYYLWGLSPIHLPLLFWELQLVISKCQ